MKELKQGRKSMFWSYKPLRNGAFEMVTKGAAQDHKGIYGSVATLALKAGGASCQKANLDGLKKFENLFLPQLPSAKSNFMDGNEQPVDFGPVQLVGGPHFSASDKNGKQAFVYLHPSASWSEEETEAFCELLTVTVESRHGGSARDVWFLDLRSGKRVPWNNSKKLVRRKCQRAAEFLVALQEANVVPDEAF